MLYIGYVCIILPNIIYLFIFIYIVYPLVVDHFPIKIAIHGQEYYHPL